jgi:hypothetical protein
MDGGPWANREWDKEMSVSPRLEKIVKDGRTRGDHHIDQFHLDHISNGFAHPARDHRPDNLKRGCMQDLRASFRKTSKHLKRFRLYGRMDSCGNYQVKV